jgi:hypothetical protein
LGKGATILDSIATRFQKLTHYSQICLGIDLKAFSTDQHGHILLQYRDDLPLSGPTLEDCMEGTYLSPFFSFVVGKIQSL